MAGFGTPTPKFMTSTQLQPSRDAALQDPFLTDSDALKRDAQAAKGSDSQNHYNRAPWQPSMQTAAAPTPHVNQWTGRLSEYDQSLWYSGSAYFASPQNPRNVDRSRKRARTITEGQVHNALQTVPMRTHTQDSPASTSSSLASALQPVQHFAPSFSQIIEPTNNSNQPNESPRAFQLSLYRNDFSPYPQHANHNTPTPQFKPSNQPMNPAETARMNQTYVNNHSQYYDQFSSNTVETESSSTYIPWQRRAFTTSLGASSERINVYQPFSYDTSNSTLPASGSTSSLSQSLQHSSAFITPSARPHWLYPKNSSSVQQQQVTDIQIDKSTASFRSGQLVEANMTEPSQLLPAADIGAVDRPNPVQQEQSSLRPPSRFHATDETVSSPISSTRLALSPFRSPGVLKSRQSSSLDFRQHLLQQKFDSQDLLASPPTRRHDEVKSLQSHSRKRSLDQDAPTNRQHLLCEIVSLCERLHKIAAEYVQSNMTPADMLGTRIAAETLVQRLQDLRRLKSSASPFADDEKGSPSLQRRLLGSDLTSGMTEKSRSIAKQDLEAIRAQRASTGVTIGETPNKNKYKRRSTVHKSSIQLQCHSCKITATPEWRRGPTGSRTLCNACGLHYAKLSRRRNRLISTSEDGNIPAIDLAAVQDCVRSAEQSTSSTTSKSRSAGGHRTREMSQSEDINEGLNPRRSFDFQVQNSMYSMPGQVHPAIPTTTKEQQPP